VLRSLKRPYAALAALTGWFALALQFYLIVTNAPAFGESIAQAVVRFFSYFTVLTTLFATIGLTAQAVDPESGRPFARPNAQTAAAVYIFVVAAVYIVFLRGLWQPAGAQKLADNLLHYAMPAIYLVYWAAFVEKHGLLFRNAVDWLIFPAVYLVYVLIRGVIIGQYPYPFIDVGVLGYQQVAVNAVMLLAVFLILGLAAVAAGRTRKS
jgi:hypothetical protein